jgi:hypothetical protein
MIARVAVVETLFFIFPIYQGELVGTSEKQKRFELTARSGGQICCEIWVIAKRSQNSLSPLGPLAER